MKNSVAKLKIHVIFSQFAVQFLTIATQILYGAVVGRVLKPADFGEFAIALIAFGFVNVVLSNGITSAISSWKELDESRWASLILTTLISTVLGTSVLYFLGGAWSLFWDAPTVASYSKLLALAFLANLIATSMSALFRREGSLHRDSLFQAIANVTSYCFGATLILLTGNPLCLAAQPIFASVVLAVLSARSVKKWPKFSQPRSMKLVIKYMASISSLNIMFFIVSVVPNFVASRVSNLNDLGQFTRGNQAAGMPSYALTTSVVRTMQPTLRKSQNPKSNVSEIFAISVVVSTLFHLSLALCSSSLIKLWLGDQWVLAGQLMPLLAIGFGANVVFTILSNAAETLQLLTSIRSAQRQMILIGFVASTMAIITHSLIFASLISFIINLRGITSLYSALVRIDLLDRIFIKKELLKFAQHLLCATALFAPLIFVINMALEDGFSKLAAQSVVCVAVILFSMRNTSSSRIIRSAMVKR